MDKATRAATSSSSSNPPNSSSNPSNNSGNNSTNSPTDDRDAGYGQSFLQNPYYFMYASLASPDRDEELHLLKDGKTRCTTGSVVSSLYHLKDPEADGEWPFSIFLILIIPYFLVPRSGSIRCVSLCYLPKLFCAFFPYVLWLVLVLSLLLVHGRTQTCGQTWLRPSASEPSIQLSPRYLSLLSVPFIPSPLFYSALSFVGMGAEGGGF